MRGLTRAVAALADDRGATIPMVALSMVVIMGMAAVVVDIGNGQRIRRAMVSSTDAAALAAAQDFVAGGDGCATTAGTYVADNEAAAVLDTCDTFFYGADHGRVTVTATHNVETWFAGVLGAGDYTVSSTSVAVWAPPAALRDLRPLAICIDATAEFRDLIDNPPSSPTRVTIPWDKEDEAACGGAAAANWGVLEFEGGSPYSAQAKVGGWFDRGYPGVVEFGLHAGGTCPELGGHCVDGGEGFGELGRWNTELDNLRDDGTYIAIPLYDFVDETFPFPDEFHIVGVVRARIVDYFFGGSGGDDDDEGEEDDDGHFIELEVEPGLVGGTCCGDGTGSAGNLIVAICGVQVGAPEDVAACDP